MPNNSSGPAPDPEGRSAYQPSGNRDDKRLDDVYQQRGGSCFQPRDPEHVCCARIAGSLGGWVVAHQAADEACGWERSSEERWG